MKRPRPASREKSLGRGRATKDLRILVGTSADAEDDKDSAVLETVMQTFESGRARRIVLILTTTTVMGLLASCGGSGGGSGGSAGTASGPVNAVAPIIATQLQPAAVGIGQSATFTVGAAGTAPIGYQFLRDGVAIPGATGSSYTLGAAQLTDSGAQFSVTVSNAVGSVTSAAVALTVTAQAGLVSIAGNVGGPGSLDGIGSTARLLHPAGIAFDGAGNFYVPEGSAVRKVTAAGGVTTFAGSPIATGSADGPAASARFGNVAGIALDAAGNVYLADTVNHTIRVVSTTGVVSTLAGTTGVAGFADGIGTAATFNTPSGVTVDRAGNVYVADTGNDTVRMITPAGVVTTLAGAHGTAGSTDGAGVLARFNRPVNLTVDAAGRVYVADTGNDTIRVVTAAGVVTTLAGAAGVAGSADGSGIAATFNRPSGIALDGAGNVYVGDAGGFTIRRISAAGAVTTIAGSAGASGSTDGVGSAARFASPVGIAADASGNLYIADQDNFAIRQISAANAVSTLAGAPTVAGSADGTASAATFNQPFSVAVDAALNVYVGDYGNATLRKITPAGAVTTLAGSPGLPGSSDGAGAAARFQTLQGLAVDASGNVYVADRNDQAIRKVTAAGVVTTFAGSPSNPGAADGVGAAASFSSPTGVAVDAAGNVYVVDGNPTVRKITPAGLVTTIAGAAGRFGSVDGPGNVASFGSPQGVAVDAAGNLYVSDATNATVRKITPAGVVSTLAGMAGQSGYADGPGASARFSLPFGIAVNTAGVVYVVDMVPPTFLVGTGGLTRTSNGSHYVRRIDTAGNVTTVAGTTDTLRGVRLGSLPGHFDALSEVAVDRLGNLYGTDANGVIRITLP